MRTRTSPACARPLVKAPWPPSTPRPTSASRPQSQMEIYPALEKWAADKTKEQVAAVMDTNNILNQPVWNAKEVANHPHWNERGAVRWLDDPTYGELLHQGPAIQDVGHTAAPEVGAEAGGRRQRAHPGRVGRVVVRGYQATGRTRDVFDGDQLCCSYARSVRPRISSIRILSGTSRGRPSVPIAVRSGVLKPREAGVCPGPRKRKGTRGPVARLRREAGLFSDFRSGTDPVRAARPQGRGL